MMMYHKQEDGEVEKVRVKRREVTIHLPWYKTQWGAGFVLGLEVGLLAGLPVAFVVYQVAKVVVHFIEGA